MTRAVSTPGQAQALNEVALSGQERREQWTLLGLSTPAILVIAIVVLVPVGWLFYLSFVGSDGQFSLEHYKKMIEYKSYARVFMTTFQVSLLTTLICILLGYPLAYFLAHLPGRFFKFDSALFGKG